jgi:protein-disulfide isomerase
MAESGKNRRDRAAAARDAANAAERRRERIVRIVGAVTVVVVVVAIIGVAVVARNSSSSDADASATSSASLDPNAALPAGVLPASDDHAFGVPFGTATSDVPVLAIWEDFQCPACDALEKANGAGIEQLASDGKITLVWRPTTFLDSNLGNDSSLRATAAFGCAIDAGKAQEYHNIVFQNQPDEGVGYTDEQLLQWGKDVGITGADYDTFASCFDAQTYVPWANNSTALFYSSGVGGTPSATLNGAPIDVTTLVNQTALEAAVVAAAGSASTAATDSASPSAS